MRLGHVSSTAWGIIAAASVLLLLSFGFRASFGLFVAPISDANHWGRDSISLALAMQNLIWGVLSVFAGGLADRFGNVKVLVAGVVFYASGLFLTAGVDSIWQLHLGSGVLIGAGLAGTGFGLVLPLMAKAVTAEDRQWVMGLGTAAGSMGQFMVVPLVQELVIDYGWVAALHVMALLAFSMLVLIMLLAKLSRPGQASVVSQESAESFRDVVNTAIRYPSYWMLTLGFFVCGFHLAFITVHFPGYLAGKGFAPDVAAWSIALIGLFNVAGAMVSGYVSGLMSKRRVLVFIYFMRGIITLGLLLLPQSLTTVILFSCLTGFLWLATVPPTTGLVATMFGTRYMATLYGVVFLGHQVGSFCGVWLGGLIYEQTSHYELVWWLSVALSLVAVALHWPIREQRALPVAVTA